MPVFLLVTLALLTVVNAVVYVALTRAFALPRWARATLASLLALAFAWTFAVRMARDLVPPSVARAGLSVGLGVELAVLVAGGLLLVAGALRGSVGAAAWLAEKLGLRQRSPSEAAPATPAPAPREAAPALAPSPGSSPAPAPVPVPAAPSATPAPAPLPRRQLLQQITVGSALAVGAGSSLYGSIFGRYDYRLEEVPVPLRGLPRALDGFTIVQLSDIHVGTFVGDAELRAAEELVRRARPDVVVLTGDLVDHDPRYAAKLGELARRLGPLAREGVVAIPGNHDYYTGLASVLGALRAAGARVLVNDGLVLGDADASKTNVGWALLGVDDVAGSRFRVGGGPDLERALAAVPASADLPRVLLCHNPVTFPQFASRVQLQLSGHTHGGQINIGPRLADYVLPHGYVAGRYVKSGGLLYVNRGFGVAGPPARIGAPPEVTRVVLTSA